MKSFRKVRTPNKLKVEVSRGEIPYCGWTKEGGKSRKDSRRIGKNHKKEGSTRSTGRSADFASDPHKVKPKSIQNDVQIDLGGTPAGV